MQRTARGRSARGSSSRARLHRHQHRRSDAFTPAIIARIDNRINVSQHHAAIGDDDVIQSQSRARIAIRAFEHRGSNRALRHLSRVVKRQRVRRDVVREDAARERARADRYLPRHRRRRTSSTDAAHATAFADASSSIIDRAAARGTDGT